LGFLKKLQNQINNIWNEESNFENFQGIWGVFIKELTVWARFFDFCPPVLSFKKRESLWNWRLHCNHTLALGNHPQMTTFGKSERVFCAQNPATVNQHPPVHHAG